MYSHQLASSLTSENGFLTAKAALGNARKDYGTHPWMHYLLLSKTTIQ